MKRFWWPLRDLVLPGRIVVGEVSAAIAGAGCFPGKYSFRRIRMADARYIHPCVSFPVTYLVLEVPDNK